MDVTDHSAEETSDEPAQETDHSAKNVTTNNK